MIHFADACSVMPTDPYTSKSQMKEPPPDAAQIHEMIRGLSQKHILSNSPRTYVDDFVVAALEVYDPATSRKSFSINSSFPTSLTTRRIPTIRAPAGKPTVLIFYRGSWCPYCNLHLSNLVTVEEELRSLGYQIVAISPDRPEELNKMTKADHLNYRLFSDPQGDAMKKFGVAYQVDNTTLTNLKQKFNVDLERSSGQTHHILPVPSVFILDRGGKIVFVHADPDYRVRMKGAEVLAAAKAAAISDARQR
jgi:peroxiredoxin